MKYVLISFLILCAACTRKPAGLELEIITKAVNSLKIKKDDLTTYYEKDINPKAKTIVVYKLTNNTDKTYYFNLDGYNKDLSRNVIRMDRAFVRFTDANNQVIRTFGSYPTFGPNAKLPNNLMILNLLNYNEISMFKNFIIHPNETLYFEWLLVLPYGNKYEFMSYCIKDFNPQKQYFAELLLSSNGVNYKSQISRTDLQTIKKNGYEVYNGVIKSKNKIPINFVDL